MFNLQAYKKLILLLMVPFITNCGPSFTDSSSEGPERLCSLAAGGISLSINVDKVYSNNHFLAYSINSNGEEINYDECTSSENKLGGFARSLVDLRLPAGAIHRSEQGIHIDNPSYQVISSYFDYTISSGPVSSDLNLKIYGRNSCDEPLELVDEFNSEIEWDVYYPNGEGCSGEGYTGSVQIQSDL